MHLAGSPFHVPPDCPARHSVSHLQTANVEVGQDSAVVFLPPMQTGDVIVFKNRVFVLDLLYGHYKFSLSWTCGGGGVGCCKWDERPFGLTYKFNDQFLL